MTIDADIWVDLRVGRDTHSGSEANPLQTIAAGLALAAAGEVVGVRGYVGERIYRESGLVTPAQGVTLRGFGDLPPIVWGFTTAGAATLDSGSVYGITVASDPQSIAFVLAGSGLFVKGKAKASKATLAADYDFFYDSGAGKVWFYLSANPATALESIQLNVATDGLDVLHDDVVVEDIQFWGHRSQLVITSAGGIGLFRAGFKMASEDCAGGTDLEATVEDCWFEAPGKKHVSLATESPGDCWSAHTTGANVSTYLLRRCRFRDALKAACNSVGKSSGVIEQADIENCGYNIATAHDSGSEVVVRDSLVVLSANDVGGIGIQQLTKVYGSTFIGAGASGAIGLINIVLGSAVVQSCIASNGGRGLLNWGFGATQTEDHNLIGGNASAAVGLTADASDLTSAPQFVDLARGDYRLKPGAPGFRAGLDLASVGCTVDLRGAARPAGPHTMGALETPILPLAGMRRTRWR